MAFQLQVVLLFHILCICFGICILICIFLVSLDQYMVVGFGYFSITCIYNLSFFRSYLIALFLLWKTSAEEHRARRGAETEPCGPLSHWYPDEKWIWEKVQCENSFPTKTTKCLKIQCGHINLSIAPLKSEYENRSQPFSLRGLSQSWQSFDECTKRKRKKPSRSSCTFTHPR